MFLNSRLKNRKAEQVLFANSHIYKKFFEKFYIRQLMMATIPAGYCQTSKPM